MIIRELEPYELKKDSPATHAIEDPNGAIGARGHFELPVVPSLLVGARIDGMQFVVDESDLNDSGNFGPLKLANN